MTPPVAAATEHAQRMAALAGANRIRAERSALKRRLGRRETSIASVIAKPPDYAAAARVSDILPAVRGLGPIKARRALVRCRISEATTIADLSVAQRGALVGYLMTHHRFTVVGVEVLERAVAA